MTTQKDYFSGHADDYAKYRPIYPPALFDYLRGLVKHHDCVWDCGTGNGQAAVALAKDFKQVIATDLSQTQIAKAMRLPNIEYHVCPAEKSPLKEHSVDLITIAQALHWFDFEKFYAEVRRVAKPGAIVAAWTYLQFGTNHPKISAICDQFYDEISAPYWAPERRYIDNGYIDIPFPFQAIKAPDFSIEYAWSVQDILNYVNTWSAVKAAQQKIQENLVETWLKPRLLPFMQEQVLVCWPLKLRVGIVS